MGSRLRSALTQLKFDFRSKKLKRFRNRENLRVKRAQIHTVRSKQPFWTKKETLKKLIFTINQISRPLNLVLWIPFGLFLDHLLSRLCMVIRNIGLIKVNFAFQNSQKISMTFSQNVMFMKTPNRNSDSYKNTAGFPSRIMHAEPSRNH